MTSALPLAARMAEVYHPRGGLLLIQYQRNVTSLSAAAGSAARRSRLRPIQRTSVDRPIPRSPAISRCVRPFLIA
jgi:hypothetical protein